MNLPWLAKKIVHFVKGTFSSYGETLWLSGKVVKMRK
jgi:hypothetical protein